jgi:ATP-dependent DNA helicase RecG
MQVKQGISKRDIIHLLWDKLPGILDDKQKLTKITNLLQDIKREGKIKNVGSAKKPNWVISK